VAINPVAAIIKVTISFFIYFINYFLFNYLTITAQK